MFQIKLCLFAVRQNSAEYFHLPYNKGSIRQRSVIQSKCPQVVASFGTYTFNSIPRLYGCDAFITVEHGEETTCSKRGRHKTCGIIN